jgi:hypothetical protein
MEPEDLATPERVEQMRRSMAKLPPGAPGLSREEAMEVLAALHHLMRLTPSAGAVSP